MNVSQPLSNLCRVKSASLLVVVVLLAACSPKPEVTAALRPVRLLTVAAADGTQVVDLAGVVSARIESRMGFRVAGKILTRRVQAGQHVRSGEELMRLDARDYRLSASASSASVAAAQVALEEARADYKRSQTLLEKEVVTQADLDKSRTHWQAMQAQLASARSSSSLEGFRVGDTVLRADADGVVSSIAADVGEVVSAGQPVLVLARDGARDIEAAFPENQIALAKAASAEVRIWANSAVWIPATLRELSAAADPVTRTFRARFSLPTSAAGLALGQSATLRLTLAGSGSANERGVSIPISALVEHAGQTLIWRYEPKTNQVHHQPVTVVGLDGSAVRVAGLSTGMQVVTAGVHVLSEGQKVRPLLDLPSPERSH